MKLCAGDGRSKNVWIAPVVVTELKFRDVQRHIFGTDFVKSADNAALEDAPEAFNRVCMHRADDVLAIAVVNRPMRKLAQIRAMLGQHRATLESLVQAELGMHNFVGMLNPTLYRDMIYSKSFGQQLRLVKAALHFLDEIDAVAVEIEKDQKS